MNLKDKKVVIVGSGMAGLASALFLKRLGAEVSLYDQFEQPQALGAGLLLQPVGQWVLAQLNLLDKVRETSSRIDRLRGCANSGTKILDLMYEDYFSGAHALGVHRGQLFNSLLSQARNDGIELFTSASVSSLNNRAAGYSLEFESRDSVTADLVIIANGAFSNLRDSLAIPFKASLYPWGALWSIFDDKEQIFTHCLEQVYDRAHTMIGMLPSGINPQTQNKCVSFFWSLPGEAYDAWRSTPISKWKAQVLNHWPAIEPFMESIQSHDDLVFSRYMDVRFQSLHDKNAVIVGDAGHAMSPQLGQGVNLALLDAWRLFESFEKAPSIRQALEIYQTDRQKQLAYYQSVSSTITPFYQSHSRILGWIRDAITPFSCWFPVFKAINLNILMGNARSMWGKNELDRTALKSVLSKSE